MKWLILGANGLIGRQFVRVCEEKGIEYVGTCYSRSSSGLISFNVMELENIPRVFDRVLPDVIINAVGLAGGVNFCEENPGIGRKYHVEATEIMVNWCRQHQAALAYISTDYVFDGTHPPYKETDQPNPLNLYGKLKLEGEHCIQANLDRYVIARTTNVFGWDPETRTPNFLMHLINTLDLSDSIKVPTFLYGNPTYAGDLAAGITDLLQKKAYGLYHIVGPGYINRFDWAMKCLQMAGITGKTIEKTEQPPANMVPRPLTSNLDTNKFQQASSVTMHDIDAGLKLFVDAMKQHEKTIREQ